MKKKLIGQLRYDFAQLGWVMAIWMGWIVTEATVGWWRWHAFSGSEKHHFVVFFSDRILPLIGAALVIVLSPALAFGHSLWRSDAFWRTRPLPVRHLYFSRIGLLFMAVGGIPFVVRFGTLALSGVEIQLAANHAAGLSLAYLAPAFAIWGLAMLFPRWRYLVAAAILLVPFVVPSLWLTFSNPPSLSRFPIAKGLPDGLWESQAFAGLILLWMGGLLSGAILFWQRHRPAGICVLGLVVIGSATIEKRWQLNLFEEEHLGTIRSQATAWVEVEEDAELLAKGELFWNSSDVPEYHWIGWLDVDTKYPLARGPLRFQRRLPIHDSPEIDVSAQHASGDLGALVNGMNRIREETECIRIPVIKPRRRLPDQWVVSGRIDAHWFGHEVDGSIPLEPGARLVRDGLLLVVDSTELVWDYRNSHQHLSIALTKDRVRARYTGNEYWRFSRSSDPFQDWHLVLQIPARAGVAPDKFRLYHFGKVAVTGFLENQATLSVLVFDKAKPDVPPMITEEEIQDCRLILLRPVYRETMSASFSGGSGAGQDAPVDEAED